MRPSSTAAAALIFVLGGAAGFSARAQVGDLFDPVTDQELQDPDPADWLMWRRTLDGWATVLSTRSTAAMSVTCGWCGHGRWPLPVASRALLSCMTG